MKKMIQTNICECIVMPEIFRLWMAYTRVDNAQIAALRRCLPDEDILPAASGRGIEGGGGFLTKSDAPSCDIG